MHELHYLAEATLESNVLKVTRIFEILANENPRIAAIPWSCVRWVRCATPINAHLGHMITE